MAYIGKTYKHDKDEQFKEFLENIGVPLDKLDHVLNSKPSQILEKNGDEYILKTIDNNKSREVKFQIGVEFEETVVKELHAKTTFTFDGEVLKQVQKFSDGRSLFIERHYSDKELIVILKNSFSDATARRIYVAA